MTQTERLIAYLRANPESTSLEITLACGIVNVTGRVSDARAAGHDVRCIRRFDNRQGYVLVEPEAVQLALAGFRHSAPAMTKPQQPVHWFDIAYDEGDEAPD